MNTQHIGIVLIVIGLMIAVGGRFFCLPGDICYQGKRFTFAFPIVTCIVVSIIVSVLIKLFGWGGSK